MGISYLMSKIDKCKTQRRHSFKLREKAAFRNEAQFTESENRQRKSITQGTDLTDLARHCFDLISKSQHWGDFYWLKLGSLPEGRLSSYRTTKLMKSHMEEKKWEKFA